MSILKKLAVIKATPVLSQERDVHPKVDGSALELTYFQSGYGASKVAGGHPIDLGVCLDRVFEDFKQRCRDDIVEQQRLNAPYIEEKMALTTELLKRQQAKENKERQVDIVGEKIADINNDIIKVRTNPEEFGIDADKRPRLQFYVGLALLIPMSLYLIVFYVSASYSAFFRQLDSTALLQAIFDPTALTKSLDEGVLETLFITTLPFVFMGLGYLIHMLQKGQNKSYVNYTKIFILILVTFLFDGLLAYLIENQFYNFNRTLLDPPFNIGLAVVEPSFWAIIFAGFVVYIIWGLVLDFVIKEHDNIDKVKNYIRSLLQKKNHLQKEVSEINKIINKIDEEIREMEGQIAELQSKIDGFIFPNRKYLTYYTQYVEGWFKAISQELALPNDRKDALKQRCKEVAKGHLEFHNVHVDDHESIVYHRLRKA